MLPFKLICLEKKKSHQGKIKFFLRARVQAAASGPISHSAWGKITGSIDRPVCRGISLMGWDTSVLEKQSISPSLWAESLVGTRALSLTVCHLFGKLHFALEEKNPEALISYTSFQMPRNGSVLLTQTILQEVDWAFWSQSRAASD